MSLFTTFAISGTKSSGKIIGANDESMLLFQYQGKRHILHGWAWQTKML